MQTWGAVGRWTFAVSVCLSMDLLGLLVVDVSFLPPENCPNCSGRVLPIDYGVRMNVSREPWRARCCRWDRPLQPRIVHERDQEEGDPHWECVGCGRAWFYHSLIDHSAALSFLLGRAALGSP